MAEKQKKCTYNRIWEPFSDSEIKLICQLKRFFEWSDGDKAFAASLNTGDFSEDQLVRLKRIGINFDLKEVELLWKYQEAYPDKSCESGCSQFNKPLPGTADPSDDKIAADDKIADYPLLELWFRFIKHKTELWRESRGQIMPIPLNAAFDAWRRRRINAVKSELGYFGHVLDHPILAFELGDGCSMGCWFCGFAARKLKNNFNYPENKKFFHQVVQHCIDLFGKDQSAAALLYYGTEPHDNPHYIDMIRHYSEMTGHALCTSTAKVTDAEWLKELIAYYRQNNYPWPRLSVLTTEKLRRIHDLYTPDELRDVELLLQMKDHPRPKVTGGRILKENAGMKECEEGHYLDEVIPQGSIACVSGFLVNLVKRRIQLISPCYTCEKWPYGYRVFTERYFKDADDFRTQIESIIDLHMPQRLAADMRMAFRDDLAYRPREDGFDLVSPNQIHHFKGKKMYEPLGREIASGDKTYGEVISAMMDTHKVNPILALAACREVYHSGFLDEVPLHFEKAAFKEAG